MWGPKPPTFLNGFKAPRSRPEPENDRFSPRSTTQRSLDANLQHLGSNLVGSSLAQVLPQVVVMVTVRRHPWEVDRAAAHSWEAEAEDSDDDPDPEKDPQAAAMRFLDELLSLYFASALSAMALCTLCYWAKKSCLSHVDEFALAPGK